MSVKDTEELTELQDIVAESGSYTPPNSRRPVRDKKLSDKGLAYQMDTKNALREYAYKRVTKLTENIKSRLIEDVDPTELQALFAEWLTLYEQFLDAYDEYIALLPRDDKISERESWFFPKNDYLLKCKKSVEKWFADSQSKRLESDFSKIDTDRKSLVQAHQTDVASQCSKAASSRPSSRSSARSSILSAKIKEEQNIAALKARAAGLKRQQALDQAKLRLKMEEEEMQLDAQLAEASARAEVLELYDTLEYVPKIQVSAEIHEEKTKAPFQPPPAFTQEPAPAARTDPVTMNCLMTGTVANDTKALSADRQPSTREHQRPEQSQFLFNPDAKIFQPTRPAHPESPGQLSGTSEVKTSEDLFLSMVRQIRKPMSDIKKFGGDPLEFKRFTRQFQSRIVANCKNDDECLNYLEQFTFGEANKIVSSFSYLDANVGYKAAQAELADRYGNPHIIVNAYVKKALSWSCIKPENVKGLDEFSVFLLECLYAVQNTEGIKVLEYPDNLRKIVSKLPYYLQNKWRNIVQDCKEVQVDVTLCKLVELVRRESKKVNDPLWGREAMLADVDQVKSSSGNKSNGQRSKGSYATSTTETLTVNSEQVNDSSRTAPRSNVDESNTKRTAFSTPCLHCDKQHPLVRCQTLAALPYAEKSDVIKFKGLCFGCLKAGHQVRVCRNRATCNECNGRHPTVLHSERVKTSELSEESQNCPGEVVTSSTTSSAGQATGAGEAHYTMAIIPVTVRRKGGTTAVKTYAFLDPGSNVSFCSEAIMRQVGIQGRSMKLTINTMGEPHNMITNSVKGLELCDLGLNNVIEMPEVYTKTKMPVSKDHIPTTEDVAQWEHLQNIHLPQIDADIGLLIGNNVAEAYTPREIVTGPKGSPHAIKTALGWVMWNVARNIPQAAMSVNRAEVTVIEELEELKKLNELVHQMINMDFPERSIEDKREWSQEDKMFMKMVNESLQFVNGHYQIPLPFRKTDLRLPDNRSQALQRLQCLDRKMKKDPKYKVDYEAFMSAVITKGYAEEVPAEDLLRDDGKVWYIPHFGVYHPKKPNKICVVFDCAVTYQGHCLNKALLQGPNLTNDLVEVLLRFRKKRIAVLSDIESMFYQVTVPREHRDCLRFFWWPEGSEELKTYRMTVHLFGAVSSPTCANVALRKTALDNEVDYPNSHDAIFQSFYVDDFLQSLDTEEEAIKLGHELQKVCQAGGFHLTKWMCNSRNVINTFPVNERAKEVRELDLEKDVLPVERVLGVSWSPENDTMGFDISIPNKPPTRRNILSIVSSMYDPLGLVAPVTLQAKIILQELCRQNKGWDEEIDDDTLSRWQRWLNEVPKLELLSLRRCFNPPDCNEVQHRQIHVFSDASEDGYGIVVYLRTIDVKGNVQCSFVLAKSRVTPLKKVTVPRLELTAAALAVRLNLKVQHDLKYHIDSTYFWTDSMAVIRYIANENTRFKTFVANRVEVIREGSNVSQWRYVDSKSNVADEASRGLTPVQILNSDRWFHGPSILRESNVDFQDQPLGKNLSPDDAEIKTKSINAVLQQEDSIAMDKLLAHYSSWMRLKRAVGIIMLTLNKLKKQMLERKGKDDEAFEENGTETAITVEILNKAEELIIRYIQKQHYQAEISLLEKLKTETLDDKTLKSSSSLWKLDPFLEEGILRVGGRLERSQLPFDAKHPVLVPRQSPVAQLILLDIHKSVGHLGKNTMLSNLRQKYWIPQVGPLIKKITSKCVTCRRYQARVGEQKMANLPAERLQPDEPPFTHVGMDYFGPFAVRRGRSTVKRYGVVFTCMTVRAVHLEVAYSLDTDSCINAIRRFVARRGQVKTIRSDNGTNLVGAERELREEMNKLNSAKLQQSLTSKGITWQFNPPAASHFGGVWERMIRDVRKIMSALMSEQGACLDDESLQTLFCEVEAILNSRPLTTVSSSPNDEDVLTPNHLLLNQCQHDLPFGIFEKHDLYVKRRWRQIQYMADIFWKRWSKNYLHTLQERQKWNKERRNLIIGDVVLVVDNSPRSSWALGRVVSVQKDRKGLVRSVEVKTQTNVLHRPIDKLCLILESELD